MARMYPSLFVEEYSVEFAPSGSNGQHYLLIPSDYVDECGLPDGKVFAILIGRRGIKLRALNEDGERIDEMISDPEFNQESGGWELTYRTRIRSGGQHLIDTMYLDDFIEGTSAGDEYKVTIRDDEIRLTRVYDAYG
jgi:hypothetical protein